MIFRGLSTRWLISLAVAMSVSVHAADAVRAGSYENPNGNLVVTGSATALKFKIDAFGANGHTCSLDGDIKGNQATLEGDESPCVVTFDASAKGIAVSSKPACRTYCGMRAQFDGLYFTPAPGCSSDDRSHTRDAFKAIYAKKDYAAARAKLEPVLTRCEPVLSWLEKASIRNDMAVTLYHLHERAACLSVLEPLAADAAKTDDAVRENYPPTDADDYLPLVKAARTNLKLCNALPSQ
jgi:hypothetical protein